MVRKPSVDYCCQTSTVHESVIQSVRLFPKYFSFHSMEHAIVLVSVGYTERFVAHS